METQRLRNDLYVEWRTKEIDFAMGRALIKRNFFVAADLIVYLLMVLCEEPHVYYKRLQLPAHSYRDITRGRPLVLFLFSVHIGSDHH